MVHAARSQSPSQATHRPATGHAALTRVLPASRPRSDGSRQRSAPPEPRPAASAAPQSRSRARSTVEHGGEAQIEGLGGASAVDGARKLTPWRLRTRPTTQGQFSRVVDKSLTRDTYTVECHLASMHSCHSSGRCRAASTRSGCIRSRDPVQRGQLRRRILTAKGSTEPGSGPQA